MSEFTVQGWCPGALRPMASGDGLVVRVRPHGGRLAPDQLRGIAAASARHGNGLIDLSLRGNVQLRGVTEASHPALIAELTALGLIDADIAGETRRNILVTPLADAETDALAARLEAALAAAPALPGKFGFVLDCGPAPILSATPGDIRLERAVDGRLILRCEGADLGEPVSAKDAPARAVALAAWFVAAGGISNGRGRMAALIARGARPEGATLAPAPAAIPPGPGLIAQGALLWFEFGQMQAETLAQIADLGPVRVTPWRMLLVEGLAQLPDLPGLITRADDPLLRVLACTGAPGCLQALGPTRALARRLAAAVPPGRLLHVSGCAKGCAHPAPADRALIAAGAGQFDLVRDGTAQAAPVARLTETDLPGALF